MQLKTDAQLGHLSDEEYFIHKAKADAQRDPYAAKCWLITAQILYPQKFSVQYEVYLMAKEAKNIKEAATTLSQLHEKFPDEVILWREVDGIIASLLEESSNTPLGSCFNTKIFSSLSKDMQKKFITSSAERAKDTQSYCSLMTLLTISFPDTISSNGLKLVEALKTAEATHCQGPLNPFRRKLVCELLPRLLRSEGLKVRPKVLHQLLTKAIEFYVACATTTPRAAKKLLDGGSEIEDPWGDLFAIVHLIGWNLGWELAHESDCISHRELILERIQATVEEGVRLRGGPTGVLKGGSNEDLKEILFTCTVLFLHALLDYIKRLNHDFLQGDISQNFPPILTLVEAFTQVTPTSPYFPHSLSSPHPFSPSSKRPRLSLDEDPSNTLITISSLNTSSNSQPTTSGTSTGSQSSGITAEGRSFPSLSGGPPTSTVSNTASSRALSKSLITAIKCWNLLHEYDQLKTEFAQVLQGLGLDHSLVIFNVDLSLYEGHLLDAEQTLVGMLERATQALSPPQSRLIVLSLNLKLASVLFALKKYEAAIQYAQSVVSQMTHLLPTQGGLTPNLVSSNPNQRHLHLLALTRSQVMQFVTTLIIQALRHHIVVEGHHTDNCIGHLIILLQYEWPKHESTFEEVCTVLRAKGQFCYEFFSAYVTTPDILEEFMYMASPATDPSPVRLDILPLPHSAKPQRTRGADRGSKLDFKAAMKRQMMRCHESVESNLIHFLTGTGNYPPNLFI